MSILVIGVNHRSAPLSLLERVVISSDAVPKALASLSARDNVREVVVLSTCNRTEVYAVAERFHGAYADIRDFLCELGDLPAEELAGHLYSQHDTAAVRHLFEVAAGLDSAVIGESEILGQVRAAWEVSRAEGAARSTLNLLFRVAVEAGKRARTETAIGRGTASISHAAVEMASERLGTLVGRRVAVVGAGVMGEGVAAAMQRAGAHDIVVVNRTAERGQALAERVGGRAVDFSRFRTALANADVVVSCTGAGSIVLDRSTLAAARDGHERPLLVVDIAVPRDVEHAVSELDGVSLLDLEDLRDWASQALSARHAEADAVRRIIETDVERFLVESTARQAAPLVAQLREHAESIRVAELERLASTLATLDDDQRSAVDALTRGIVAKILHQPSIRLKAGAGTPQGERNSVAVRDLFDLG
jgi:glutamyl-tRNA reductase